MNLEPLTTSQRVSELLERSAMLQSNEVRGKPETVPAVAGVYAWWSDTMPGGAPKVGVERDGRQLIYVGIAPRKPAAGARIGRGNLRARLLDHCDGPSRSSTFRRTLVALLADELGIVIARDAAGKILLVEDGEARISAWIDSHCMVSCFETAEPWLVEEAILTSSVAPSLNIQGSANAFANVTREKRRA